MINRRTLLTTSLAAAAVGTSALAQRRPWVMPEEFKPRVVTLQGDLPVGEIHVDPRAFALYWTLPEGKAIRYTCGIGKAKLYEAGKFHVGAKKHWPAWTPTQDMIERDPGAYKKYEDGMPGGINNPLGSRALYLFTPSRGDTFLRIHGTSLPWTIASAVSNGCVRLTNAHIAHLYQQVPQGTKVVLH